MSAQAVSLAETDRLESLVVPFIPARRLGSDIDAQPLKDLGPDDAIGEGMVGRSAALRQVIEQLRMVAPTDASVLICGETRTGKELIARAVRNLSGRHALAFVMQLR